MNRRQIKAALVKLAHQHEAVLEHGWHLSGPGPARWGWAYRYVTGAKRYLGGTLEAAYYKASGQADRDEAASKA